MATYTKQFNKPYENGWKNAPADKTTPITAEALNAITNALDAIDTFYAGTEQNAEVNAIDYAIINNMRINPSDKILTFRTINDSSTTSTTTSFSSKKTTELLNEVENTFRDIYAGINNVNTNAREFENAEEGSMILKSVKGFSYQYDTPTPTSPQTIFNVNVDIKTNNANLIPYPYYKESGYSYGGVSFTYTSNGELTLNGKATTGFAYRPISVSDNIFLDEGTYYLSGTPSGHSSSETYLRAYKYVDGTSTAIGSDYGNGVSITLTERTQIEIRLNVTNGYTCNNEIFYPMLIKGNTQTDYIRNKSSKAETDLVLRAIEVSSTDYYNLVRDGKYYVADELIFDDDKYKVVRRIYHTNITSDMSIIYQSADHRYRVSNPSGRPTAITSVSGMSNCGKFGDMTDNNRITVPTSYNFFLFYDAEDVVWGASLDNFKIWLDENDVYIDYILATPTIEELTDDAIELLNLKSFKGKTYITVDTDMDSDFNFEYAYFKGNARALSGYCKALSNEIKIDQANVASMLSE